LPGAAPAKTTYESAPILRDLRKEAAAFVPVAVKRKLEIEKAQKEREQEETEVEAETGTGTGMQMGFTTRVNAAPDVDVDEIRRFAVEVEEAEDDGR